VTAICQIWKYK